MTVVLLLVIIVMLARIEWNTRQRPFQRPWWNRKWRKMRGRTLNLR